MSTAYSVKNVKTFRGHDGHGFNAGLYKDGKRIGMVIDLANGGGYDYELDRGEYEALSAHFKAIHDKDPGICEWDGKPNRWYGVDSYVGKMVDDYLALKQLKGWCRTKIVCKTKENKDIDGAYISFAVKYSPEMAAGIRKDHPDVVEIVNERF